MPLTSDPDDILLTDGPEQMKWIIKNLKLKTLYEDLNAKTRIRALKRAFRSQATGEFAVRRSGGTGDIDQIQVLYQRPSAAAPPLPMSEGAVPSALVSGGKPTPAPRSSRRT